MGECGSVSHAEVVEYANTGDSGVLVLRVVGHGYANTGDSGVSVPYVMPQ